MSAIAFCARTLLPALSSGGEMTAMPHFPGATAMSPLPTPFGRQTGRVQPFS
jgi:hypothetical protein